MVKRDYRTIYIMLARTESNFLTFKVLLKSLLTWPFTARTRHFQVFLLFSVESSIIHPQLTSDPRIYLVISCISVLSIRLLYEFITGDGVLSSDVKSLRGGVYCLEEGRYGFINFWACWSGLEDYKVIFSQVNKFSSIKGSWIISFKFPAWLFDVVNIREA